MRHILAVCVLLACYLLDVSHVQLLILISTMIGWNIQICECLKETCSCIHTIEQSSDIIYTQFIGGDGKPVVDAGLTPKTKICQFPLSTFTGLETHPNARPQMDHQFLQYCRQVSYTL